MVPMYPKVPTLTSPSAPSSARGWRNVPCAHDARTRVADAAKNRACTERCMLEESV